METHSLYDIQHIPYTYQVHSDSTCSTYHMYRAYSAYNTYMRAPVHAEVYTYSTYNTCY